MMQAGLIRKLQTLTPNSPYASLLKAEFDIDIPESVPQYKQEYLYKYCLQLDDKNLPKDQLVMEATELSLKLYAKYPWVQVTIQELTAENPKNASKSMVYADETVVLKASNGMYLFWLGGKIDSRSNSLDGLKKVLTKKYGTKYVVGTIVNG